MKTICLGALYMVGEETSCPNSPIMSMARGVESAINSSIVFLGGTGTDSLPALAELDRIHPRFDFSRVKERTEQTPLLHLDKAPETQFYALGAIGYLSPSLDELAEAAGDGVDFLCIDFWCEREWIRALTELKKSTGCRIAWNIPWARSAEDMGAAANCADILLLSGAQADKLNDYTPFAPEQLIIINEDQEGAYMQVGPRLGELTGEQCK